MKIGWLNKLKKGLSCNIIYIKRIYQVQTGNFKKEISASCFEEAIISAFAVNPPEYPGELTRIRMKNPVKGNEEHRKQGKWHYQNTVSALRLAGYSVFMKKSKPIKKFNRFEIKLSQLEKAQILKYLVGDISSRELGKNIGYSHQGAINFVGQVCRQWFQRKNLRYKE